MFRFFSFHYYLLLPCLVFTCFCVCSCVLCLLRYLVIINLHHLLISKNSLKITFSWLVIISLLSYMFFFHSTFYIVFFTHHYFFFNLQLIIAISNIYFARTWKSFFLLFIQLFQFIFSIIFFFNFIFGLWIYLLILNVVYTFMIAALAKVASIWWSAPDGVSSAQQQDAIQISPSPHTHKSMHEHSFFWFMIQNIFVICIICK